MPWTQADVDAINARRGAKLPAHLPPAKKRHKYGAESTSEGGHQFDSKKEARRYTELLVMQRSGLIRDLKLQPHFVLMVPRLKHGEQNINEAKIEGMAVVAEYRADFSYWQDGVYVVEDVKSAGTRTQVYALKRKMFEAQYQIKIRET